MRFACYFRPNHVATGTKVGIVEAASVDDARSKAEAKLKSVYPDAVLVDVCDEAERVEPADRDSIYAFFWKESPRGRINGPARVVAETIEQARELAKAALASAHPGAFVDRIVLARRSPIPVKNARGIDCDPSFVY